MATPKKNADRIDQDLEKLMATPHSMRFFKNNLSELEAQLLAIFTQYVEEPRLIRQAQAKLKRAVNTLRLQLASSAERLELIEQELPKTDGKD